VDVAVLCGDRGDGGAGQTHDEGGEGNEQGGGRTAHRIRAPVLRRRLELAGGQHIYAWPMKNGVCYSWPGAVGCTPTAVLAQKGALVGTGYTSAEANPAGNAPEWQVFALARDGISELRVALHSSANHRTRA
jgi:hypothetical protein